MNDAFSNAQTLPQSYIDTLAPNRHADIGIEVWMNLSQQEVDLATATLACSGIPDVVTDESYSQVKQPPQWVRAGERFDKYARVIDYLGRDEHGMSEKFAAYLRFLEYTCVTTYETAANPQRGSSGNPQRGSSCAIVAARLTSQLHLAKHLGEFDWYTLNVTDATNPAHILEENRLIEQRSSHHNDKFTRFLRNELIERLHSHWVVSGAEAQRVVRTRACAVCSYTHREATNANAFANAFAVCRSHI